MSPRSQVEIETLFRRESGRLISVLTRIFGPQNLGLAKDVVQESFVVALSVWSERGMPKNPVAWLLTTARNRAIDAIRRERTRTTFASDLAKYLDSDWTLTSTVDEAFEESWVHDDQLRMIFLCCHRSLTPESQVTLILKTMCGLSVPAIARALLTTETTINKRLYRTRRKLRGAEFALPTAEELPAAREILHTGLYLLFCEGYQSTSEKPILLDLCREAMRLTKLVVDEAALSSSETVAILALMSFNAARFESRVDQDGRLIPLDLQDRSRWDWDLISQGFGYLRDSSRMETVVASRFHLEAAIAARHCSATTFSDTDWDSICNLYDRLLLVQPSPIVELNRAVAISYRSAPAEAIPLVEALHEERKLPHTPEVAALLANLYARAGSSEQAQRFLDEALAQARTEHERYLIELQIRRSRSEV